MNQLNPELKRLLRWARKAPALAPEDCSWGFPQRVVKRWCGLPAGDAPGHWQRVISGSIWPAAAVLLVGLAILLVQSFASNSAYDFSPAYQVVSIELVP
jgi:hypothetical protein